MRSIILFILLMTINRICNAGRLELPVIEAPFNFTVGYVTPGPDQSLYWSTSFMQWFHKRLDRSPDANPRFWNRVGILGFDFLSMYLPLGPAWLHEEWHRGVMGRYQVNSYNAVYDFKLFASTISVNNVTDEDLARLKATSPADFVRLPAAGMESEIEQNGLIEKMRYFEGSDTWDVGLLFLNYTSVIGYINTCSTSESDSLTDEINRRDGADIKVRDFTGLDCLGWVYDLFRPDEAYANRGAHPSGVGVNRYRKLSDLTDEERKFLGLQANLSFLNLVNPSLWGFGHDAWTFSFKHYLTSFGYAVDLNILFQESKYFLQIHDYQNARRFFPGITLGGWRQKFYWEKSFVTYSVSIWQQPQNQRFNDENERWGLKTYGKLYLPYHESSEIYISLSAKTPGWVAGDFNLGSGFDAALGLVRFF